MVAAQASVLEESFRSDQILDAVSAAIAAGGYAAHFEGSPTEVTAAGRSAAVQSQMIPAGGPVVYVIGAETAAGTDVLVCTNSSP